MGGSDAEAQAKAPKTANAAQNQHAATSAALATPAYPDWSGYQAYSTIPPHGFFPPPVASSPMPHPYMWGPQPIRPPYGTPPPPYVMYPHGLIMPPYGTPPYVMYPHGVYAHPSIPLGSHPFSPYAVPYPNGNAEASGAAQGGMEVDCKSPEGKEKSPLKSSNGSLGSLNMISGKNNNDPGKTSGASANGGMSHSGESGSEASSEGSDANSQNVSQPKTAGGQDSYDGNSYDEAPQTGNCSRSSQNGVPRTLSQAASNQTIPILSMSSVCVPGGIAGPTTNLNIGMDYWGATASSPAPSIRTKVPATAVGGAMVHGVPSELWTQDERELKRQRRKQSNRESARRSRMRKQAECEELAQRVDVLKEENASLRAELDQTRKEYDQLLSHNASLKEKLKETPGIEEDPRADQNGQNANDCSRQRPSDSDVQSAQNSAAERGH